MRLPNALFLNKKKMNNYALKLVQQNNYLTSVVSVYPHYKICLTLDNNLRKLAY